MVNGIGAQGRWLGAAVHGVAVSAIVLGLFYRWFAVADRYAIFLYEHLGATSFDRVTRSRYWMAGLVAAGMVMVGYVVVNWAIGRATRLTRTRIASRGFLHSRASAENGDPARAGLGPMGLRNGAYDAPAWWRVWVVSAPVLMVGIPLITMTVNEPTLGPGDAAACVAAAAVGLAFALMPGAAAAERPAELLWIALYGMGLMPALLLIRALELPGQGLVSPLVAGGAAMGGTLAGWAWLVLVAAVEARWGRSSPTARTIFASGICVSYLFMPVVHHLLATPPGYRYISTSSNFFADHVGLQLLALLVGALLAAGAARMRGWGLILRFAGGRRSLS
jgi:hypothetical protein